MAQEIVADVQFLEGGDPVYGRGAFPTRALAVQRAEIERDWIVTT